MLLARSHWSTRLDGRLQDAQSVHRLFSQRNLAARHAGNIEKIVEQPADVPVCRSMTRLESCNSAAVAPSARIKWTDEESVRADCATRAQHREEIVLYPVACQQLLGMPLFAQVRGEKTVVDDPLRFPEH
jgi:hypothetical protein